MTEAASPSLWWSIPQAIVWIVTRNEAQVLRAASLRVMSSLRRVTAITSGSSPEESPVSFAAAPDELIRAWQTRRISLHGRKWAGEPSQLIPNRSSLRLRDRGGQTCLGEDTLYFETHPYWSDLWVRVEDCKRCWPGVDRQRVATSRSSLAARRPSDSEVRAFIEEKREALRAERKRAGRDVLLRAAENHFGLSHKGALGIWNSVPRDRKGGRPKNAKTSNHKPDR